MEARRISIRERIHRQHEIAARMATEKVRGGRGRERGGCMSGGAGALSASTGSTKSRRTTEKVRCVWGV